MEAVLEPRKAVIANAESERAEPISCPSTSKPSLKRKRGEEKGERFRDDEEVERLKEDIESQKEEIESVKNKLGAEKHVLTYWYKMYHKQRDEIKKVNDLKDKVKDLQSSLEKSKQIIKKKEELYEYTLDQHDAVLRVLEENYKNHHHETECYICEETGFVMKICQQDCKGKVCFGCYSKIKYAAEEKNKSPDCPTCRGWICPNTVLAWQRDVGFNHTKFLTETPIADVRDDLRTMMSARREDLSPIQISQRLDALFAQVDTQLHLPTVEEMFEAALPPMPTTPAATVSGSHSFRLP